MFLLGLIYGSDEIDIVETIGHIGQIEENIGQYREYGANRRPVINLHRFKGRTQFPDATAFDSFSMVLKKYVLINKNPHELN